MFKCTFVVWIFPRFEFRRKVGVYIFFCFYLCLVFVPFSKYVEGFPGDFKVVFREFNYLINATWLNHQLSAKGRDLHVNKIKLAVSSPCTAEQRSSVKLSVFKVLYRALVVPLVFYTCAERRRDSVGVWRRRDLSIGFWYCYIAAAGAVPSSQLNPGRLSWESLMMMFQSRGRKKEGSVTCGHNLTYKS